MKKELRVYVVDITEVSFYINSGTFKSWNKNKHLPKEAKEFIQHAENNERVYTIEGFMNAFNSIDKIDAKTDYIFITDKY
jgi:ABC-type glycerol-3-phosphate transport system substrate-binding protein